MTQINLTTIDKPLLRALQGKRSAVPPIWLMRQAGRYLPEYRELRRKTPDFLGFCLNPELAAEATLQPIKRFGFDAAILFADILVVPHGLGQKVAFREGEGPVLEKITDRRGIDRLSLEGFRERVAPVGNTVTLVKQALPDKVALIGFAGAPWTVATYMVEGGSSRDFAAVKHWAYGDPASFEMLIDCLADATIDYLLMQIAAGAEIIQLFDSWAGVLPERWFRRYVIEPTRRIVSAVRKLYPAIPIIGFPRGAGILYQVYGRETGVGTLCLDTTIPLSWARDCLQPIGPVQGNLDPVLLVAGGAAMAEAIRDILGVLGAGPLVFNLGHGILPETPLSHVQDLIGLVRGIQAEQ